MCGQIQEFESALIRGKLRDAQRILARLQRGKYYRKLARSLGREAGDEFLADAYARVREAIEQRLGLAPQLEGVSTA